MTKIFLFVFLNFAFFIWNFNCKINDDSIQTQLLVVPSKPSSNEPINFNFVRVGNSKSKNFYIENAGTNSYTINRILFSKWWTGSFFLCFDSNCTNHYSTKRVVVYLFNLPTRQNWFILRYAVNLFQRTFQFYLFASSGRAFIGIQLNFW